MKLAATINTGQLEGLLIHLVCNEDVKKEDRSGAKLPAWLHFSRERSEKERIWTVTTFTS